MKMHVALGVALLALSSNAGLANDWSGFYAGAGVGNLEVDPSSAGNKNDDTAYSVHAGYRYDAGQWVLGGELEYELTDFNLAPGISVDRMVRLKATAGYDFGPTLLYLAAGAAEIDIDGLGEEWGEFYGVGAAYAVSPQAIIGLELLEHDFSDIDGTGVNADAWSINLRASWKF